jgi:4-amino-4-deoxy-L-arabinose transferase-like glycosyltransferase
MDRVPAGGRASVYSPAVTSGRRSDDPEASGRILFAIALAAGALLRLVLLGQPDLFGSDEGRWAIGARNLVAGGADQFLGLSATPLGPATGTPILFPWVLSAMVRVFGPEEWAVRLPSAILGLIGAFVLERVIRRGWGQPAGHLAGAFAALFPPLVAASRAATVEPTLVTLGLAGIIFGLRAFEEDVPFEGAVSGVFFGLGFLAKGYAVGLYLITLLLALLARPRLFGLGRTKRALAYLAAAFAAVGFSHLLAVFLFRREAFSFALATSFGASEAASRAAALPTAFGADVFTLMRSLFFFLPLAALGVVFLGRAVGDGEVASGATGGDRRLAHGILWGACVVELAIVVAVAGRYRLSSIPMMPALAAFTGLGGTWLMLAARERTSPVPGRAVKGVLVALLAWGGLEAARQIRHDLLTHRTGARELADQLAPALAPLPPGTPAFRSDEPEGLEFRLFRTGLSWDGVTSAAAIAREAANGRPARIQCWAYRTEAAVPPAEVRAWLKANAKEITADVNARAGRTTGLRAFVP